MPDKMDAFKKNALDRAAPKRVLNPIDPNEFGLSKEEQFLYKHHVDNFEKGGVKNEDGSISTIRTMTVEMEGITYVLPTVWGNKIVDPEDAIKKAEKVGLEKFPHYSSEALAQSRDEQVHNYMMYDVIKPKRKR